MSSSYLEPQLLELLNGLRHRVRRYILWDSLLAILAIMLGAFWIGMAIDYLPILVGGTEMPRSARMVLFCVVLIGLVIVVYRLLIWRIRRALPNESLALLIERQNPHFGGRLVTAVQLSQPGRDHDNHAPSLLRRVYQEALAGIDQVDLSKIFHWSPITRKASLAVPLLVATLGLLAWSPLAFSQAVGRLLLLRDDPWPRRAQIEITGLEIPLISAAESDTTPLRFVPFQERVARVPTGARAVLRVRAAADPFEIPDVCTLYYRYDNGTRGQANMRRIGRIDKGYQGFALDGPPLDGLTENLSLTVRGLDAYQDHFRIEVVEPPELAKVLINANYPSYLSSLDADDGPDLKTPYQSGLRIIEGSVVELIGYSTKPLGNVSVAIKQGETLRDDIPIHIDTDGMRFRLPLGELYQATSVVIVPADQEQITSQTRHRFFLGVVTDTPPNIELRIKGVGTAVTPNAIIPVEGRVEDDYWLASTRISIAQVVAQQVPVTTTLSVTPNRNGTFATALDLRNLVAEEKLPTLSAGEAISLFGEATDHYDLGPRHVVKSSIYRLELVTAEALLAILERRELGLRTRLEQMVTETASLRDNLDVLRRNGFASIMIDRQDKDTTNDSSSNALSKETETKERATQLLRLRVQQAELQASKTVQEVKGIAEGVEDILAELTNNRIDSVDRQKRLREGVAVPLWQVAETSLPKLSAEITEINNHLNDPAIARNRCSQAIITNELVLRQLMLILEKMVDLENYNEILDLLRGLIESQENLIQKTKQEKNQRVFDLFK